MTDTVAYIPVCHSKYTKNGRIIISHYISGELECPYYTHKESEMVHEIMDEAAKQIGRHLPHSVLKS